MGIKDWQVCPSYVGKRLFVDLTNNMFGDIKVMLDKKIIKGEDIGEKPGSEWERLIPYDPGYKFTDKDIISFRRLPEKSEMQKWLKQNWEHLPFIGLDRNSDSFVDSFAKKMIEVAEKDCPVINCTVVKALKRFAGVK